jgi:hypothetical protein
MKARHLAGSLAAAGTLAALCFALAAPAVAASGITVTQTPSDGAVVTGNGNHVNATASYQCTVLCTNSLSFQITDPSGSVVVAGSAPSSASSPLSVDGSWDTQPTAKPNGVYQFSAHAVSTNTLGQPTTQDSQISLKVNNPPVAPSGVKVALDASNVPVVSWNANPEPDIIGYEVFRSDNPSQQLPPAGGTGTSYHDTSAPKGQPLAYEVAAVRASPVSSSGIVSSTSPQTDPVTVPAPTGAENVPQNVATIDPPPAPKPVAGGAGTTAATGTALPRQALSFNVAQPTPIQGPTLPTQVVIGPQPNVVQFAPLLPYSGKIPEIPVTTNVPAPVAANSDPASTAQQPSISLPGGVKVTPVDAVKYVATAAFLIVAAVHLTRFARKLRNAPV